MILDIIAMSIENHAQLHRADHKIMYEYEYLCHPLSAAISGAIRFGAVGGVQFGVYGAITGFFFGAIDALAIHYDYYQEPYLSFVFQGYSFAYGGTMDIKNLVSRVSVSLLNYLPNDQVISFLDNNLFSIVGGVSGGIIASGVLNNFSNIQAIPSAIMLGRSYGRKYQLGFEMASLGGGLSILDEILIRSNVTKAYYLYPAFRNIIMLDASARYLGSTLISKFNLVDKQYILHTSSFFQGSSIYTGGFYMALFSFVAYFSSVNPNKMREDHKLKSLNDNIYKLYTNTTTEKRQKDLYYKDKHIIATGQLTIFESIKLLEVYKSDVYKLIHKVVGFPCKESDIKDFNDSIVWGIFFASIPYLLINLILSYLGNYFTTRSKYSLEAFFDNKVTTDRIALSLDHNASVEFKNMQKNLDLIAKNSDLLMRDGFSNFISGLYAIKHLYQLDIDIVLFSFIYNKIMSPSYILAQQKDYFSQQIKIQQDKINSLNEYIVSNTASIAEAGSMKFVQAKLQAAKNSRNIYEALQDSWDICITNWDKIKKIMDIFISYGVAIDNIHNILSFKSIESPSELENLENRLRRELWPIITSVTKVMQVSGWEDANSAKIVPLEIAISDLSKLKHAIEAVDNHNYLDGIQYLYKPSESNYICFNNFAITRVPQVKLYIDNLCITDRIMAIIGPSGCGKSTVFKIIKKLESSIILGSGYITYYTNNAKIPEILMTSQEEKFVPHSSIMELITLKAGLVVYQSKIKELLNEVKIEPSHEESGEKNIISRIDEQISWEGKLSGGQKQKIIFVRIILKIINGEVPNFILFDEIFKGMDADSIITCQKMIKKYIPQDTKVWIIEHHVNSNNNQINGENFYSDNKLFFVNDTLIVAPSIEVESLKEAGCNDDLWNVC